MKQDFIQDLGKRFGQLFYTGVIDTELEFEFENIGIQDAYQVQDAAISIRKLNGEHIAGYKVGCTSQSIRKQLNLTDPYHAKILGEHIHITDEKLLNIADYVNCAIEPELVICLGADIDEENLDDEQLKQAIAYLSPGIEIHNFKFWFGKPTIQELIMSNGLFACLLVGEEKARCETFDFHNARFSVASGNDLITTGNASTIMGGPLKSLRWLVKALATRGETLKAGQFIIPGSPVELIRIERKMKFKIEISGVGSVSAEFI